MRIKPLKKYVQLRSGLCFDMAYVRHIEFVIFGVCFFIVRDCSVHGSVDSFGDRFLFIFHLIDIVILICFYGQCTNA